MHDTAEAIRLIFAIALTLLGLSHFFRGPAWAGFFSGLAEKGQAGVITNALLHLWPGLLIVGFHRIYEGGFALFTMLGWLWVAKAGLYLLFPSVGLRSMTGSQIRSPLSGRLAGGGMLIVACVLWLTMLPVTGVMF